MLQRGLAGSQSRQEPGTASLGTWPSLAGGPRLQCPRLLCPSAGKGPRGGGRAPWAQLAGQDLTAWAQPSRRRGGPSCWAYPLPLMHFDFDILEDSVGGDLQSPTWDIPLFPLVSLLPRHSAQCCRARDCPWGASILLLMASLAGPDGLPAPPGPCRTVIQGGAGGVAGWPSTGLACTALGLITSTTERNST